MLQSFFRRCSATQAIPWSLRHPEVLYLPQKNSVTGPPILRHINPVPMRLPLPFYFKLVLKESPNLCPNGPFPSRIPTEVACALPTCATRHAYLILLDIIIIIIIAIFREDYKSWNSSIRFLHLPVDLSLVGPQILLQHPVFMHPQIVLFLVPVLHSLYTLILKKSSVKFPVIKSFNT